VVLVGIAQEKSSTWRSWPTTGQEKAPHPHMEWGRQMAFVNHFYLYLWDGEFGPAFIKTNAVADLDLPQPSRVGETPVRPSRDGTAAP
jgi:hypothetical protein